MKDSLKKQIKERLDSRIQKRIESKKLHEAIMSSLTETKRQKL